MLQLQEIPGYGQAIGSQYFGPVNNAMMQSYKNVVGGFPKTDPFVDTGGGDNQLFLECK
jgi:hypothetical protein